LERAEVGVVAAGDHLRRAGLHVGRGGDFLAALVSLVLLFFFLARGLGAIGGMIGAGTRLQPQPGEGDAVAPQVGGEVDGLAVGREAGAADAGRPLVRGQEEVGALLEPDQVDVGVAAPLDAPHQPPPAVLAHVGHRADAVVDRGEADPAAAEMEEVGVHGTGVGPVRAEDQVLTVRGPPQEPIVDLAPFGDALQGETVRLHHVDLLVEPAARGEGERQDIRIDRRPLDRGDLVVERGDLGRPTPFDRHGPDLRQAAQAAEHGQPFGVRREAGRGAGADLSQPDDQVPKVLGFVGGS
jgi:hypothetical protein